MSKSPVRTESHRIYWQRWASSSSRSSLQENISDSRTAARHQNQPQPPRGGGRGGRGGGLITSSTAVRMSTPGARACDVTKLLRKTLQIDEYDETSSANGNKTGTADSASAISTVSAMDEQDSLVLVGTLYSLPRDHVEFEHERAERCSRRTKLNQNVQQQQQRPTTPSHSPLLSDHPFNLVRTLRPHDDPLAIRDAVSERLNQLQRQATESGGGAVGGPGTAPTKRTIISPKLQWFYVPGSSGSTSPIPNCIELDGYCTSPEDEEDDSEDYEEDKEEEDEDSGENDCCDGEDGAEGQRCHSRGREEFDLERADETIFTRFSWMTTLQPGSCATEARNTEDAPADDGDDDREKRLRCRLDREDRMYHQLESSLTAIPRNRIVSGYLLKRSKRDPQLWRRVHCVMTDEHLWYVSRIYSRQQQQRHSHSEQQPRQPLRFARHGRIRLTQALLLEPSVDYAPLYRTPHAFELVSAMGASHVFRAPSKYLQRHWIRSLSERILQSFENSLIDHAQMLITDECRARNRRIVTTQTAGSVWDSVQQRRPQRDDENSDDGEAKMRAFRAHRKCDPSSSLLVAGRRGSDRASVGLVLRWAMEVAEYREYCRHTQTSLPPKSPIVVTSPQASRIGITGGGGRAGFGKRITPASKSATDLRHFDPVDMASRDMIRTAWNHATHLLSRATQLATQIQAKNKPSTSIETQCRHIEYVITGRFRPRTSSSSSLSLNGSDHTSSNSRARGSESSPGGDVAVNGGGGVRQQHHSEQQQHQSHQAEPPPVDLFDYLLAELQSVAAANHWRQCRAKGGDT